MDLWSIWGVHQPWVYVNSAICEMYWVYWCSIDLWSIGGWSICHGYMCILLYLKPILGLSVLHGSMVNLGGWVHLAWAYVHYKLTVCINLCSIEGSNSDGYVCILLCVRIMGYNRCSMDLWSIGGWSISHGYMCNLSSHHVSSLVRCNRLRFDHWS